MKYSLHTLDLARDLLRFVEENSIPVVKSGSMKGKSREEVLQMSRQAIEEHHPDLKRLMYVPYQQLCSRREAGKPLVFAFWNALERDRVARSRFPVHLSDLPEDLQGRVQTHLEGQPDPLVALEQLVTAGLEALSP